MKRLRTMFALVFAMIVCCALDLRAEVVTYPAPDGEQLSTDYAVEADGKPVPVYRVKSQWHEKVSANRTMSRTLHLTT